MLTITMYKARFVNLTCCYSFFTTELGRKQKTPKKFTGEQPSISGTFGLKGYKHKYNHPLPLSLSFIVFVYQVSIGRCILEIWLYSFPTLFLVTDIYSTHREIFYTLSKLSLFIPELPKYHAKNPASCLQAQSCTDNLK